MTFLNRLTLQVQTANVLFVDSPVGVGYSYIQDDTKIPTTMELICHELIVVLQTFLAEHEYFRVRYIINLLKKIKGVLYLVTFIRVFLNVLPIWQFGKRVNVMVIRLPNR